ncbi:hypothetical protein N9H32_00305 [Gammaproteobacteria bacterium]|nr:hypothetical protein [Gammaproteobacteria bacterium]MDA8998797.1 hypothetical protein [Gammaproteobacteria bacterium]
MKLISKISLFFICCTGTNILFGQDAYFGDLDPGSASSQAQSDYYDSFIEQISSYL